MTFPPPILGMFMFFFDVFSTVVILLNRTVTLTSNHGGAVLYPEKKS